MTCSPDGKRIASAAEDGTVRVWNVQTGDEVLVIQGANGPLAFSPDGQRIACGSGEQTVKVWDAHGGKEVLAIQGTGVKTWKSNGVTHVSGTECPVAFSRDGQRIACGSDEWNTVKIRDANTGEEVLSLRPVCHTVTDLVFSPDDRWIASSNLSNHAGNCEISVWDAKTGTQALSLKGHTGYHLDSRIVLCIAFSPDGKRFASGGCDRSIKVWDTQATPEAISSGVTGPAALSPDGKRIVSGSEDRTVRVWDAQTGLEVFTLQGRPTEVSGLAFSPDGQQIISCNTRVWEERQTVSRIDDCTVKVWDAKAGREMLTLIGHISFVNSAAFSPDGKRIVSGSDDHTVRVWDAQTGQQILSFPGHIKRVNTVAFSPNGKRIVSGGDDKEVKVWNAQTGQELLSFPGHKWDVRAVAFSPDGKRIASGGEGDGFCLGLFTRGEVRVWDAETGQESLLLLGHKGTVRSVAFSPDGKRIVSGGEDRTVRLWDAQTGVETLTLEGHLAAVTSVAFSPDGQRIASACCRQLKVWDGGTRAFFPDWLGERPSP